MAIIFITMNMTRNVTFYRELKRKIINININIINITSIVRPQAVVTLRVFEYGGRLSAEIEAAAIIVPVRGAVSSRDGVYVRDEGRSGG